MERAALYRRALGPTLVGIGAPVRQPGFGVLGWAGRDDRQFVVFWVAVALLAVAFAGFRVRRQASAGRGAPFGHRPRDGCCPP